MNANATAAAERLHALLTSCIHDTAGSTSEQEFRDALQDLHTVRTEPPVTVYVDPHSQVNYLCTAYGITPRLIDGSGGGVILGDLEDGA